jgi:hypothetical protein
MQRQRHRLSAVAFRCRAAPRRAQSQNVEDGHWTSSGAMLSA